MKIAILMFGMSIRMITADQEGPGTIDSEPSNQIGAAMFDLSSDIFLCNGVLNSPVFIFTSCRCLCSGIAIAPYYVKRNATLYGLDLLQTDDPDKERQMKSRTRTGYHRIETFIIHPYCFRSKVSKPYRKHFGLIVLKGFGLREKVVQTAVSKIVQYDNMDKNLMICKVVGLQTDDGKLVLEDTEMALMNVENCLWRLCVPLIGCSGDSSIRSGQELCLTTVGNRIPKLRVYEGSEIICDGEQLGLIVSTGRIRYPDAPLIVASIKQFVDNIPRQLISQESGSSETSSGKTLEIHWIYLLLILSLISYCPSALLDII